MTYTRDLGRVVGAPGPQGPQGVQGEPGITPSIRVGTVTTLPSGSAAAVSRRADSPDASPVLDFALPAGADSTTVPRGLIAMWSGAEEAIPAGWLLCDGTRGTPDLRDRFIVGAGGGYPAGNTGGAASVALTVEELAAHGHAASVDGSGLSVQSAGAHTHTIALAGSVIVGAPSDDEESWPAGNGNIYLRKRAFTNSINSAGAHTHALAGGITAAVESAGGGAAHENRPPYYALCFIMKE